MADSHVVSGLKAKRDEIKRAILDQERKIKSARGDLPRIIFDALRDATRPLSTTELAAIVMQAKGFDTEDRELATRVSHGVGMALNRYRKYGQVTADGFAGKVRVWRIA